jgi:hypothetical protein
MSLEHSSARCRFGKIPRAVEYSGVSRATLYNWAAEHPGLFVKHGAATIVDFNFLDSILDNLQPAKIKPPQPRRPPQAA